MPGHDPWKISDERPIGFLVRRIAVQDRRMAGKITLRAQQRDDELLEIGPLVLAESMSDMEGIFFRWSIFTPHADRSGVMMHHFAVHAEVLKGLNTDLGEYFPGSVRMDTVQDTPQGVVTQLICPNAFSQEHLDIPHTEKFLHPVQR